MFFVFDFQRIAFYFQAGSSYIIKSMTNKNTFIASSICEKREAKSGEIDAHLAERKPQNRALIKGIIT
jgi:hypothetical protein